MKAPDLTHLTVAEAASLIREGELSPIDLVEAALERIKALEPHLNAFITVMGEQALATAKVLAQEAALGHFRGPLHGIPVGLKDLFFTKGVPTTAGSPLLADHIPEEDATVVARLRQAGAVIVGKLNLHEFALGATSNNPHYGPVRNPWDTQRVAGGSSGGSAAAVAVGECLAALGTDTGGSIRIPSSLCGITGLKPTYGRVSLKGVIPLSWSLDHVGPMASTAQDCALLLQAIAGPDGQDPTCASTPVPDYLAALQGGIKGLRIGVPKEHFWQGLDGEVEEVARHALEVMAELGATLLEVSLPYIEVVPQAVVSIMLPEALAYHLPRFRQQADCYGSDVRLRLEMASLIPAVQHVQAQRVRRLVVEAWQELFREIDLLATPTTPITAPTIEEGDLEATLILIRNTNPFNLTGQPAISIPCGFTRKGMPVGLQLVGRWWEEGTLLRAAHAFQQVTTWHRRRPPLP